MSIKRKYTPPEIAKLWGVSADKILSWIRAGELRAIDASTNQGGRPRYLVDMEDLASIEIIGRASPILRLDRST